MHTVADRYLLKTLPLSLDELPFADALGVHLRYVHRARNQLGAEGLLAWARAITALAKAHRAIIEMNNAPALRAARTPSPHATKSASSELPADQDDDDEDAVDDPARKQAETALIEKKLDALLAAQRQPLTTDDDTTPANPPDKNNGRARFDSG